MFRSTYTNAYAGALQDLIDLENLLHRTQTEMNEGTTLKITRHPNLGIQGKI